MVIKNECEQHVEIGGKKNTCNHGILVDDLVLLMHEDFHLK